MLVREGGVEFWEEKALEDLNGGAEKGDGTESRSGADRFAELQDRDHN